MSPPPVRDVETTQQIQRRAVPGDQIGPLVTRRNLRAVTAFGSTLTAIRSVLVCETAEFLATLTVDASAYRNEQ